MLHKRYQLIGKDGQLIGYLVEDRPVISRELERFLLFVNVATISAVALFAFWVGYSLDGMGGGLVLAFMGSAVGLFVGEAAERLFRWIITR